MDNSPTLLDERTNLLVQDSQVLVPWWNDSSENILKSQTEKSPGNYLDGYFLFLLNEISVNSDCEDIPKFINERFHVILSAANTSGISVMILINSKNGRSNIYIGFRQDDSSENNPELFESIINGVFPGKKISLQETVNVTSLVDGHNYGGMVTGVPTVKKDNQRQQFNLASVSRSLYGKDYTLAIISKPVTEESKLKSFNELIQVRDRLHALAKATVGHEKGIGKSFSDNESTTKGKSESSGRSIGIGAMGGGGVMSGSSLGGGFGFILNASMGAFSATNLMAGLMPSYSKTKSQTASESKTTGTTKSTSDQQSRSLSMEQQNGVALELEKIADHYIERMIQGFNAGYWETSITFACKEKIACDILGGSFVGELSKPNDKILPPPRLYMDKLENEQTLFFPIQEAKNTIFPKKLASYVTSEELAFFSSPPTESLSGYEIKKMPALALTDFSYEEGIKLGNIADHGNQIEGSVLSLSRSDLNKHLFVCGLTGSGKTTTIKHILKELNSNDNDNVPFLIIESAKRDYRQLLADDVFKDKLNIFTIGDATVSPIRINPFYIQKGVHPLVHIDFLKAIFNASFSLYGPMPHIVEKCLHNIYLNRGWNLTTGTHPNFVNEKGELCEDRYEFEEHYYCFPTLTDLTNEVESYVNKMGYEGELKDNIRTAIVARLESLCVGAKGLMFNTYDFYSIDKLLAKNTILEMENLADDDDKAFFVGLMLVLISEYRQKDNPAINPGRADRGLQHFIVIEEAHRLLKNVETERTSEMMGNPKGKAVEVFCNVISEMRSLGQGVAVVEQIPTKISPDVIKNSNTKVVHRLVSKDDQSLLAGSLSISDEDALYLNRLNTGHALCHKEGMERPVECVVFNNVKSHAISDDKVSRMMGRLKIDKLHSYKAYELDILLKKDGEELAVKTLNLITMLKSENLRESVVFANNELKKLILFHNAHNIDYDNIIADYFTLQMLKLLSSGIYSRNRALPAKIKQLFFDIFENSSTASLKELILCLGILWKSPKVDDFIKKIVENLTVQYLFQRNSSFTNVITKKTVASFFLMPDAKIVSEITENIINKQGS